MPSLRRLASRLLSLFGLGGGRKKRRFSPEPGPADATRFRALYASVAVAAGESRADIARQVFLPMRSKHGNPTPKELKKPNPVAALSRRFRGVLPSHYYRNGLENAVEPRTDARAILRRRGPVTLVVCPGIFGEFVDLPPFDSVVGHGVDSAFRRRVGPAVEAAEGVAFSLESLTDETLPLSELVNVGSIDDADGSALVEVILLRPAFGTLETLGDADECARVYADRLDRVVAAVPEIARSKLHLLGYSRGAGVALSLLVQGRADAAHHAWAKRVKGLITLAGVVYGSDLADRAFEDEDSLDYVLLRRIEKLARELEVAPAGASATDEAKIKAENTARWGKALARIAAHAGKGAPPAGMIREGTPLVAQSAGHLYGMLRTVLFDLFQLDRPGDYFDNVRRFKRLVGDAVTGLRGLRTKARVRWWRENVLPDDVIYHALTGSMADPTRGLEPHELVESPYYGCELADHRGLRTSYYATCDFARVELNDGQVAVPKARFWPGLGPALNPDQPRLETRFLGVLGTHHWGLGFPFANETAGKSDEEQANPFPRRVLLEALAAFVVSN
jgi:hypothetical protein